MSNNHQQLERDPNDPVDALLSDWKESLQCSDAQLQQMLKNVLPRVDTGDTSLPVHRRVLSTQARLLICSLAASLLIGLGVWYLPRPQQGSAEIASDASESLHRIAFSTHELQQDQLLACELARVFEKPVLVLKHDSDCDIDDDPFVADAIALHVGASRVLLRYVVQELSQSQTWLDIAREEVIGGREQHLHILNFPSIDIKYWSHLLPDDSLWVELQVQADQALDDSSSTATTLATTHARANAATNQPEHQLKANEPKVVWEHQASDARRRLVMVFELLPSCDFGDVL